MRRRRSGPSKIFSRGDSAKWSAREQPLSSGDLQGQVEGRSLWLSRRACVEIEETVVPLVDKGAFW